MVLLDGTWKQHEINARTRRPVTGLSMAVSMASSTSPASASA
jgi:hypothetical protein